MIQKTLFKMALIKILLLSTAQAVPLFGETAGTIREGMLTLYKDHQNPKKVYFFPSSTKISKDNEGAPLFSFVYWGLDTATTTSTPGAFLTFSSHPSPDENQHSALENFMKKNPSMEVAVLPIKKSMIGLQTTVAGEVPLKSLFSEFNFAKYGGRAEDEIGINAVLTSVGARAFKALLSKDGAGQKLKFDYCYTVQGFGPNMNAQVKVDMRRVYDYFEGSHSGGWGWFSWNIKTVIEKLHDQRVIQIEMNGGDAKQWEVLNTVASDITHRLFRPELSASPVSPASSNRLFRFGAGVVKKEELKQETWNYIRRDLEEREFCTAVAVKDLTHHLDKIVINADL